MTKEENTLKPCPFCGSEAWANCRKADGQYCIECNNYGDRQQANLCAICKVRDGIRAME